MTLEVLSVFLLVALHKIELFCIQLFLCYAILQYEVYWDPGNAKEIGKYNSYIFPIHKILSIPNVVSIYLNNRKFVAKNVHRGHTYEQIS